MTETKKTFSVDKIAEVWKKIPLAIQRALETFGGSSIPLTAVFEELGYSGLTGLGWGILTGVVTSVALGLGYEVRRRRRVIYLQKAIKQKNTNMEEIKNE